MKGFFYLFMAAVSYTLWYFRYVIGIVCLVLAAKSCLVEPPKEELKTSIAQTEESVTRVDSPWLDEVTKQYYDEKGRVNPPTPPDKAPRFGQDRSKDYGQTAVIKENLSDYADSIHMSVYQIDYECGVSPSHSMPEVFVPWYCYHFPNGNVVCEWQVEFGEYGVSSQECYEASSWNRKSCKWEQHPEHDRCEVIEMD